MTPNESLIALLGALYLSDCWYLVPHGAVVFSSPLLRGWKCLRTKNWLGTQSEGWILLQALPPLGRHVVCDDWPLAVAPDAAVPRTTASSARGRARPTMLSVDIESAHRLRADGKRILSGRLELARAASGRAARRMVTLLRQLGELGIEQRQLHIEHALAESFDCQEVEARRAQLHSAGAMLLRACNVLFCFLAIVVPLVLALEGIMRSWIWLLAILIGMQCWVSILFARAHRRLYGEDALDRRSNLLQMALSPPLAVRAHDALSRDAFAEFHPVAVASVLTAKLPFLEIARAALRECRFGAGRRHLQGQASLARSWFDARSFEHMERIVTRAGSALEELVFVPPPEPGALVYCPVCHTQFSVVEGWCEDCDGVLLIAFEAAAKR